LVSILVSFCLVLCLVFVCLFVFYSFILFVCLFAILPHFSRSRETREDVGRRGRQVSEADIRARDFERGNATPHLRRQITHALEFGQERIHSDADLYQWR
jgi:hypothetical protein